MLAFKIFKIFNLWLLLLVGIFFCFQSLLKRPDMPRADAYIVPPIEVKYLTAGFSPQAADSFWLRAIQDMDYCEQQMSKSECVGRSWFFNIINIVVELDNKFKEAFYYGALALTILIQDYPGATIIFDKGIENFSQEWPLLYAAGYHALYEEKNKLKASKLYLAASENGAPDWVRMMAGRLASEGGDNLLAKEILQHLINIEKNPEWIEKLKNKINQMDSAH